MKLNGVTLSKAPRYKLLISRLTVDKLGVKLYDRVSAVIAEIIANSYDADATEVVVSAPMGEWLASKSSKKIIDKNYTIEVQDNGIGMTPQELSDFYLVVGKERRADSERGDESRKFKRKVMGRKGVGKLAPLGICEEIELITSGGKKTTQNNKTGYLTGHIILRRKDMLTDSEEPYEPIVGEFDGILSKSSGTTIRMKKFDFRHVPEIAEFDRQLSQRFGVESSDWKIILRDNQKTESDPEFSLTVGAFCVETKPGTRIVLREELTNKGSSYTPPKFSAYSEDEKILTNVMPVFEYEGREYPVIGWLGYSKLPYKDELMAGVRIYCRGKIVAQTKIFNLKGGFSGEYDIRSYLVGSLEANWLDEEEDLIRTDRQDILWSHPLTEAFEAWGQSIVKHIGKITREPMRKAAWDRFKENSNVDDVIANRFPAEDQRDIRERTLEIAKTIAQSARSDELEDPAQCQNLLELAILLGPHISLEKMLNEAANFATDRPLEVVTDILRTARVAELSSFGRIADERVKVIKKLEQLKDDPDTLEQAFQRLIEQAPWLINPQWSPISANISFATLKKEFAKFYKNKTGYDIELDDSDIESTAKRPDFVMSNQDRLIQIIEIKRPHYALTNDEVDRIVKYVDVMEEFLKHKGNEEFAKEFASFHITLVCDKLSIKDTQKRAFEGLISDNKLLHMTWAVFLSRTEKMHEAFLQEAERQIKNAPKK